MEILHSLVHSDEARKLHLVTYAVPMSILAKASLNESFLVQTCAIIALFKFVLIEKTSLLFSKEKSIESSNWLLLTEVLKSGACSSCMRDCGVDSLTLERQGLTGRAK